ncbi:MAG: amino acid permease [Hydrotalea sp.]|nr:amino acid permease [Hydrotalea sp.]
MVKSSPKSSFVKSLSRTKKIGAAEKGNNLKRVLGGFDLTLLGIGGIIGTGIFVLTGIAAANQAGPALIISFILAGAICALAALAYAELASAIGGSGSAYSYAYATIGELVAWIIGWDLLLEYVLAVPTVSIGWSGYVQNILQNLGFTLPDYLAKSWREGGFINLPAVLIVLAIMMLLNSGVKHSARLNGGIVFIKLLVIVLFIVIALFHIDAANWHPFMPYGWFGHDAQGLPVGIIPGAAIVFFSYIGFDAVSTAANETKNPQRNMPIGILCSLAVCTVAYIIVTALLTSLVPYKELGVAAPVAYALQKIGLPWAASVISIGALAGITSVILVMFYGATRLIYAIARDGLLPVGLSAVNPKAKVPRIIITGVGIIAALIAGFFPLTELSELINIGTLAAFLLVCLSVVLLRLTHPTLPRPFKNPLGIAGSVLGAVASFALMLALPALTWWRFAMWLLLGLVIYFAYGRYNSQLAKPRKQ